MQDFKSLILPTAPPLDPAWLAHEEAAGLRNPKSKLTTLERQPIYAAECRARNEAMMAEGARDNSLSRGIKIIEFTIPAAGDAYEIPVLKYELEDAGEGNTEVVVIYYHGGGLLVGEADSEDLSCRRITKAELGKKLALYSIGYRLMPQVPATTCVSDSLDATNDILANMVPTGAKVLLAGSSSGAEIAALVSQKLNVAINGGKIHGVLLRCPVTVDPDFLPAGFKGVHTSASESFVTTLLGKFERSEPRDGLERMPLECSKEELKGLPKTWIQVCSNDVLYSDGLCYAMALQDAGVDVKLDVVKGYPHTFWLKAPHLQRALEADLEMLSALKWILGN